MFSLLNLFRFLTYKMLLIRIINKVFELVSFSLFQSFNVVDILSFKIFD